MQNITGFKRHSKARVVTPDAPHMVALVAALEQGASIVSGPDGIAAQNSGPQRLILRSSGSTGTPKIIRRTPQSWTASFAVNAGLAGIGPGMRVAVLSDFRHSLALYAAIEALHLGAEIACLSGQSPRAQIAALKEVDLLYATPTQLRVLLAAGWENLPPRMMVGGGQLGAGQRAMLADMGTDICEFYGATETSFIAMSDETTPEGAVGHAYPGVEIRCDARGLIWARSPYLFEGYDSHHIDHREDGFVSVGEVGTVVDGQVFLHGRVDRMVTIADQNVHPEAVEATLATLEPDRLIAVLARPDPLRGHALVAVVSGAVDMDLAAQIKTHAAPVAVRDVVFRSRLPMLASGKVNYCALQMELII